MKQALLIASFGTTVPRAEQEAAALERALAAAAPGWTAVRAYTSGMVRRVLARQGRPVDSPAEALAKLQAGGAGEVFVQPTHFLRGIEYDKLKAEALAAGGGFARLRVGRPLLDDTQAVREMAALLAELYPAQAGQALVLMGHGTAAFANLVYPALQAAFALAGRPDVRVGTVEGWPSLEEVRSGLRAMPGVRRVRLAPLMLVAGDHVQNDMAGQDPGSWKNILTADGYQVDCVLQGLAAQPAVQQLYAARLRSDLMG